jgi:hypothetical protein
MPHKKLIEPLPGEEAMGPEVTLGEQPFWGLLTQTLGNFQTDWSFVIFGGRLAGAGVVRHSGRRFCVELFQPPRKAAAWQGMALPHNGTHALPWRRAMPCERQNVETPASRLERRLQARLPAPRLPHLNLVIPFRNSDADH